MQNSGLKEVKGLSATIKWKKKAPRLEIFNEDNVPMEYVTVETISKVDSRRILSDMKNGVDVSGCKIIDDEKYITIKRK